MKVLGIDPGTTVTGYGIVETGNGAPGFGHLVECGVIRFARGTSLPRRLHELHDGIADLIKKHRPTHLAIENAFYHKNVRTTLVAQREGLTITEFPPATVKKTVVGVGGAAKAQVGAMVARLLHLRAAPRPADAADGVAVALTCIIRA